MKQIKFKQLATFGLCCSLLVNSLTGVTAVAETVTIESSPTKRTSASEGTTETAEKTKIEQTEQTAEVQNQQEQQETVETSQDISAENNQSESVPLTEGTTSFLEGAPLKIESRGVPLKTVVYPKVQYDFVDETGVPFVTPLSFSGNYQADVGYVVSSTNWVSLPAPYNKLAAQANGVGSYILSIGNDSGFPITQQMMEKYGGGGTSPSTKYRAKFQLDKLNIATSLKFVDSIEYDTVNSSWVMYVYAGANSATGVFDTSIEEGRVFPSTLENTADAKFQKNTQGYFEIVRPNNFIITSGAFADFTIPGYNNIRLFGFDGTQTIKSKMIYKVIRKQVTEKFVDGTGATITPPTGFSQNQKTPMTSNNFTYTSAKEFPDTYQANGKTYKFKGWYKGRTKPATLKTTKTPSYAVTYDGNDDLSVVYEEANFPEETFQFGFVNEAGKLVNPSDIHITYDYKSIAFRGTGGTGSTVSFGTIATNQSAATVGTLKNVTFPATNITLPSQMGWNGEAYSNFSIKLPRYYQSLNLYDKTGKINANYPLPILTRHNSGYGDTVTSESSSFFELTQRPDQSYTPKETYVVADPSVKHPTFLSRYRLNAISQESIVYTSFSGPVYYHLTNRKVIENFVDDTGAKITPPADFTQGKQTVIDSDNFTYTSAKALPASYTADGKSYVLQGWYKGTEKPTTLETSKTPSYSVTYNDQDDLTVVYKEGTISADLTMRGAVDVIDNGAPMEYWEVLLKNTGEVPLTSIKIKPTTDWMSGISAPTELFILGTGQNTKARPITKEQWEAGFEIPLDSSLPVGGQLTINLIGTKVTGQPGQVLEAAVEVTGNFGNLKASDTVRIKDLDQEIKEPTGEGFISVPTFDFGQVGVASATKQHGLKKAADYYGNGTRNPYVRISKTQPNWSLTAQLSQPKSATDSLPTATRLLLGAAPVSSFSNYNQPTELKNAIGTTNAIHLTANNAATSIIANQQFTGSDVYQLDFTFDNIKLEVPANQGTAGQQYQAAVTWNLVTGP
ncbi:WxL domain-containing protein [Enterococcus faecalis]|nr:WxL domain-containing protein [Enterococcus faecalis]EHH1657396.1 WxL domain-containing protein [Enterococcus faecalis]EHZ5576907.1 WxL domain-containing protein [Enterococcus faecalis]